MGTLRLVLRFIQVSFHEETIYKANFMISLVHSLLNLATGTLGLAILFGQVERIHDWDLPAALALLGVYLVVSALRGLVIGPGLDSLAGMDGEIWTGKFDFTLLRPVRTQILVSVRRWRLFSLFDLLLGLAVVAAACLKMETRLGLVQALAFLAALAAGILILYAILLAFAALVFWSPAVLFTWVFDGLFGLARFPLGLYPGWLRLALTWVVPVGVITTVPAQALTGALDPPALAGAMALAGVLNIAAAALFRRGLTRYASASS